MEPDGRWYANIPEWEGSKEDLEMVYGADSLLLLLSEGSNEVRLNISDKKFENADELCFLRLATEIENGAYYNLPKYKGINYTEFDIWLCDVVKFVFGYFPEKIYFCNSEI